MAKKVVRLFSIIFVVVIIAVIVLSMCSCREADIANYNLSKSADYFDVERRITVYNARTDALIFSLEGYFSLSNNSTRELVVTCKTGHNEYRKNYIYLTENTLYVVEDITGTHADPYHYVLTWHTNIPIAVEFRP